MNTVVGKFMFGGSWSCGRFQYNGCKWRGGVLRVEKAKEHYMDRLRREWAEAEAEAAVKARIVEEAAVNAISQSRDMYSSKCEDASGSPESNRVDLVEFIGEESEAVFPNITSHFWKTLLVVRA